MGLRSGFLDVRMAGESARFHNPLGYVPPGSSEAPVLERGLPGMAGSEAEGG